MATTVTFSNDVTRIFEEVQTLAAAATLTAADSGTTYILKAAEGKTITLPALKSGINFKFIVGSAFATTDWIIDSAEGGNIEGLLIVDGDAVVASGEDQINFVASDETVGDHVSLSCDGTNWFVSGAGNLAGSITVTDPT